MQPHVIYTREYPPMSEVEMYPLGELQVFVRQAEEEKSLLEEETRIFGLYLRAQKDKDSTQVAGNADDDEGDRAGGVGGGAGGGGGGRRRGRNYQRRTSDHKDVYLLLEDKHTILLAEQERLKAEREKGERQLEDAKDLLRATFEEAQTRIKEVKMEMAYFKREVAAERDVSADKILKYFADRPATKENYIRKLKEKCTSLHQSIAKLQTQLRSREDQGDQFQTIDFDQLKIENHQFNERIDQKNAELVDLKGTTTRTVQELNKLTDRLNQLLSDQIDFKKQLKSRQEHVEKVSAEIEVVRKEAAVAQKKSVALKLQNEAVKVPKVEDYIAQKAEMYELEKAAVNWKRKVEIASGHVAVMKQQMLSLRKSLTAQQVVAASGSSRKLVR